MTSKLLPLLFLIGCGPDQAGKIDTGPPAPPVDDCDYKEYDTGLTSDLLNAQFIATLPVFTEQKICGAFTNTIDDTGFYMDQDEYLFPLVGQDSIVNFSLTCDSSSIMVIDFYAVYDDLPPLQVGHFIGSISVVNVLDWPIPSIGTFKNNLILQISSYSPVPGQIVSEEYELKFW